MFPELASSDDPISSDLPHLELVELDVRALKGFVNGEHISSDALGGSEPVLGRLVGESALEADVARGSVLVDDDAHRDAAGRTDGRPLLLSLGRALLVHAGSLARESPAFRANSGHEETVRSQRGDRPKGRVTKVDASAPTRRLQQLTPGDSAAAVWKPLAREDLGRR